jgi:hypothetical protein
VEDGEEEGGVTLFDTRGSCCVVETWVTTEFDFDNRREVVFVADDGAMTSPSINEGWGSVDDLCE